MGNALSWLMKTFHWEKIPPASYRPLRGTRAELAAVCSRTREQAAAFARRHAIPRVFTDYRALVESPDVDVVDICATTDSHHEIAIAAAPHIK